jgi:PAS domain S-box-containing protein
MQDIGSPPPEPALLSAQSKKPVFTTGFLLYSGVRLAKHYSPNTNSMGFLTDWIPHTLRHRLIRWLGGGDDRFSRVFNTSAEWIVITRLSDTRIEDANTGFETISGYRREDVLGTLMSDLNVWVYPEQRTSLVDEMLRNGVARDHLVTLRRRNGEFRDCVANAALIALNGPQHSHAVWIARDVTEETLIHAQFKASFQLTPDFMSISHFDDGSYVEVNAAFERITGISRAQAIGRTSTDLLIWAEPTKRQQLIERLELDGAVHDYPMTLLAKGELRDARLHASIYKARGVRYLIALLRDVTDELRSERALIDSESRFARLFDQSPLAMCYTSSEDQYGTTQWNLAWFEAFGFDPVNDQGKSGSALGVWVGANDRATFLERTLAGAALNDQEVQMRRKDGMVRWISVSTRLLDNSERTLILFSYFDITERRQAREAMQELNSALEARVALRTRELQSANGELSQTLNTLKLAQDQLVHSEKMAALGSLVAGVAHELNTPIGNGLTVASTLEHRIQTFQAALAGGLRKSDLDTLLQDMQLASDILVRNPSRAASLVTSFKQVAVDQTSSQRRSFNLQAVVGEILLTLNPALRKTACTVNTQIEPEIILDSYPGPLGQVLTNLINNAVLHGFAPEEKGNIEVLAWRNDFQHVVLEVRDTGHGISADNLSRVFDPFFTTRLGQGGSGLGLHIVHNLVHSVLGGRIEVQSRPNQGACFRLTLPLQAPERTEGSALPVSNDYLRP